MADNNPTPTTTGSTVGTTPRTTATAPKVAVSVADPATETTTATARAEKAERVERAERVAEKEAAKKAAGAENSAEVAVQAHGADHGDAAVGRNAAEEKKKKDAEVVPGQVYACSDLRRVQDDGTVEGCGYRGKGPETDGKVCPRCGKAVKAE